MCRNTKGNDCRGGRERRAAKTRADIDANRLAKLDIAWGRACARGSRIVEPLEKSPEVLRQFTVEDIDGNRFYFHCD